MIERLCLPIQEQLDAVEKTLLREVVSGVDTIDSIAKYVVKNGGKRIRPALFLLASKMVGATKENLPRIAAAIEMLHTASLLHDDVIDDAAIRRGQPSAKAKWGNQVSVLIGDLLLCRASKIIVDDGARGLMNAAIHAIGATTEGELLEIAHQNDTSISADVYMKIISGKTAALFSLAARAAAIVGGVEKSFEDALQSFGFEVGQAFQLADDALDYVADEELFGKTAGTDLKEGKLTYPLIVALAKANAKERAAIRNALIAGQPTRERFREVSSIIDRHNGIEATWELAKKLSQQAKSRLQIFKPSIERDSLSLLADYAVDRRE